MNLLKTFLRPVAFVGGLHASSQLRSFLAAHQRTCNVQDDLLRQLLARHAETDFGRQHRFASIRTYADFTAAVPVGSYESFRPYVEKVLAGRPEAMLPPGEPVQMFSMTSGTTGLPKFIPVTARFAAEMKRGWNIFGLSMLRDHDEAWLRPIAQISSPMREMDSPTGLPCGAISGLLASKQKKIVRRMYVVPPEACYIPDAVNRYYAILRCTLGRDVSMITTANPSSTIKLIHTGQQHAERLIRDVAEGTLSPPADGPCQLAVRLKPDRALAKRLEQGIARDGKLLPKHFWKVAVLANWTGGTLHLYLRRLKELFDGVAIRDIGLLASEGRFSIPLSDNSPAGVAEITANFLEFIPAGAIGSAAPPVLRAHEVEVGQEYGLVISNWTGLWRYNLDDRVRVVDRLGQSPIFEFLNRGGGTANITGEKLTEHQVVQAMQRASGKTNLGVERFVLQGHFAATPFYQLSLDGLPPEQAQVLANLMDASLCKLNIEYESKRRTGRLAPIQPVVLNEGSFERAEREKLRARHGRTEQYKHQYLLSEIIDDTVSVHG